MKAFDFMGKHPFLTFFTTEMIVVNICKLVNNIALYKTMGTEQLYETVEEPDAEDLEKK